MNALDFSKNGKYLILNAGTSAVRAIGVYRYPEIIKVGEFSTIDYKEINGMLCFTPLHDIPKRNTGTELDQKSTGVSKFDYSTGKITVVK